MKSNLFVGLLFSSTILTPTIHASTPPTKDVAPVVQATPSKIDLNTANATDIAHVMKGIGVKRAQAIVTYREQHHGFHSLEELGQVPGLGKRFVEGHLQALQAAFSVAQLEEVKVK